MCRRVQCSECKRPSYEGCGQHIEQVLGAVPPEARCTCARAAEAARPERQQGGSAWKRLFGG